VTDPRVKTTKIVQCFTRRWIDGSSRLGGEIGKTGPKTIVGNVLGKCQVNLIGGGNQKTQRSTYSIPLTFLGWYMHFSKTKYSGMTLV